MPKKRSMNVIKELRIIQAALVLMCVDKAARSLKRVIDHLMALEARKKPSKGLNKR